MKRITVFAIIVLCLASLSCATAPKGSVCPGSPGSAGRECAGKLNCTPDNTHGCNVCDCVPDPWWKDQTYEQSGVPPFKSDNRPQQPGGAP